MSKKDKKNKKKHSGEETEKDQAKGQPAAWNQHAAESEAPPEGQIHINKKAYEKELARLQVELVKLQEWVRQKRLKVVVIFEGRAHRHEPLRTH